MIYGYARCSTNETKQDLQRQVRELKEKGAQSVRCEFAHGDSRNKPELAALLDEVQQGDTIIVTEVSRIARSTKQLCDFLEEVKAGRLRLEVLGSISIDCTSGELDPMSAAFLQMAGVFAELELQMTRERVRSGIANARSKGKRIGRPTKQAADVPKKFRNYYARHMLGEMTMADVARVCGISRTTAYAYAKLLEQETYSD